MNYFVTVISRPQVMMNVSFNHKKNYILNILIVRFIRKRYVKNFEFTLNIRIQLLNYWKSPMVRQFIWQSSITSQGLTLKACIILINKLEEKNSWLFFYYDNKDFFLFMRTHGIYKKIKPSRILIILQCIASVIRPEVVMQIKKKLKKNLTNK